MGTLQCPMETDRTGFATAATPLFRVNSNLTLSAKLFKIKRSLGITNPLSRPLLAFGMSDVQFCKARVSLDGQR
jgi:hypothetical protein